MIAGSLFMVLGATGVSQMKIGATGCQTNHECSGVPCLLFGSGLTWNPQTTTVSGPTASFVDTCEGNNLGPLTPDDVTYGTGINATWVEETCNLQINAPQWISNHGDCKGATFTHEFFNHLVMSTGIWVEEGADCIYTIQGGPVWCEGDGYVCTGVDPDCNTTVACQVQSSLGTVFSNAAGDGIVTIGHDYMASTEGADFCTALDDANYHTKIVHPGTSQMLVLGRGLQVRDSYKTKPSDGNKCKTLITNKLTLKGANADGCTAPGPCAGPAVGRGTNVETISSFTCAGGIPTMKVEPASSPCTEGDYYNVKYGPNGLTSSFDVVTGVVCSGDSLEIRTMGMVFCDGLLMSTGV